MHISVGFQKKKLCHERVHSNIFMNSLHMYMWVKSALVAWAMATRRGLCLQVWEWTCIPAVDTSLSSFCDNWLCQKGNLKCLRNFLGKRISLCYLKGRHSQLCLWKNILDKNKSLKGTKCVTVCEIFKKLYLSGEVNNIVLCYTYR